MNGMAAEPRPKRRWQFAAAAALALVAGVALGEWLGWPFLVTPLQTLLSDKLGRRVSFAVQDEVANSKANEFQIRFLGGVWLHASQLKIAAPAWSSALNLISASDVTLEMRYVDLWRAYRGQRLRIQSLQAAALEGDLERRADGSASWQFGAAPVTGNAQPPPLLGTLQVAQGVLRYNDALLAVDLDARLSIANGASSFSADPAANILQMSATGHYRKQPLKIELMSSGALPWEADGAQSIPVGLTLNARVGRADLNFKGSAVDLQHLGGLSGRFRVTGPSLAAVGDPLGVTLPTTSAFRTDGRIVREGDIWRIVIDDAIVGASRLSGAFTYEAARAVPMLSGHLRGSRLMLVDLGPVVGTTPKSAVTATPGDAGQGKKQSPGKVLPGRPFDLATLRKMDANVLIDIADVDLNTRILEPLHPLHAHLELKAGVLTLRDIDARTADGQLKGDLALDGRAASALWTANVRWDGVRLERWVHQTRAAGVPPFVSGRLNGRANLQGQGRSTAEILATLKGSARTELRDGAVSHLLVEAGGLDVAQALGVLFKGDDALPVQCAVADLVAQGGLFRPRVMVVDTTDSAVWIEGSLSLATEALDLRAVVMPKDFSPLTLRTPLHVRGSFGKPEVSVEKGPLGVKLASAFLLGLINPLAALIPLIDPGDADAAKRGAAGCQGLMQRSTGKRIVSRPK